MTIGPELALLICFAFAAIGHAIGFHFGKHSRDEEVEELYLENCRKLNRLDWFQRTHGADWIGAPPRNPSTDFERAAKGSDTW